MSARLLVRNAYFLRRLLCTFLWVNDEQKRWDGDCAQLRCAMNVVTFATVSFRSYILILCIFLFLSSVFNHFIYLCSSYYSIYFHKALCLFEMVRAKTLRVDVMYCLLFQFSIISAKISWAFTLQFFCDFSISTVNLKLYNGFLPFIFPTYFLHFSYVFKEMLGWSWVHLQMSIHSKNIVTSWPFW